MTTALVWLHRDFRLHDHPALHHALQRHEKVVLTYIHAPEEEAPWQPGAASNWWLHHSLLALQKSAIALGGQLVVRQGDSLQQLQKLIEESQASAVYWNRLYEPAIIARDKKIKESLKNQGIQAESFKGALLFEPWELKTGTGGPYKVFSPFWRNAEAQLAKLRAPYPAPMQLHNLRLPSLLVHDLSLLPTLPWDLGLYSAWKVGESVARSRLQGFLASTVSLYKENRDFPAVEAGSRLSPHLHFGEVSPLEVLHAADHAVTLEANMANIEHFLREIGWREFAHHLLFHFPHTPDEPLYEKFAAFPWREDYQRDLPAWQRGNTGFPIVDAGMRQLWQTGWMHNRVRMIVGSFLTKNLLSPWQEGARWFWDTLVDANLASNTLGWQWAAGCGADAAPYFRIFNPVLQSQKFDPDGRYIKAFIPELTLESGKTLHAPNGNLLRGYPRPIVDLSHSHDRALRAYDAIKGDRAETL
jgi:deoxyribodipyrimidine photo-lyase